MKNLAKTVDFLAPVQDDLLQVEELMLQQADGRHPLLSEALRHLLLSGGKRVRPGLALLMGKMLDGDREKLIILSAGIELLHTATLVHDDLIDGAILRRGMSTINAQWSPGATVLTGDFIFSRAAALAAETNSIKLMHMFAETLTTIVSGEVRQLFSKRGMASREEYDQRIYAKTASLFELSAKASAMLSPVDEEAVEAARSFGHAIGLAFQIVDDVLDFIGDESTVGKPVASDLRQGLITLPVLYFIDMQPDNSDIQTVLSTEKSSEAVISRLVEAIRQSGAIEQAMQDARNYVEQGLTGLMSFPNNIYRCALEDLARYHVNRVL